MYLQVKLITALNVGAQVNSKLMVALMCVCVCVCRWRCQSQRRSRWSFWMSSLERSWRPRRRKRTILSPSQPSYTVCPPSICIFSITVFSPFYYGVYAAFFITKLYFSLLYLSASLSLSLVSPSLTSWKSLRLSRSLLPPHPTRFGRRPSNGGTSTKVLLSQEVGAHVGRPHEGGRSHTTVSSLRTLGTVCRNGLQDQGLKRKKGERSGL